MEQGSSRGDENNHRELKEPLIPWTILEDLVQVLDKAQAKEDTIMAKVVTILDKMHLSNR
jgi:hypothetical protein